MRLVDEIEIYACSGKGGDGVVRFSAPKKHGGKPTGGNGGRGGDVIIEAVDDITVLRNYLGRSKFIAQDGQSGADNFKKGKDGEDIVIKVPVGSVVYVETTQKEYEFTYTGERKVILKGGRGGYGNARFKSSVNRSPKQAIPGQEGMCSKIKIELRLISDIGLVGYPNAGKSSLINALSGKNISKVGNYEFTTLHPHLAIIENKIIADIPGIIKDAHKGKGLGDKFLKHIMRTKALFYCISVERDDVFEGYLTLKKELENYKQELIKKPSTILLTKKDLLNEKEVNLIKKDIENKTCLRVIPVSIYDENSLKYLKDFIKELKLN